MVIKLSFSRMSSSNQSVLVLKSASYRDIHSGPLLLKSWKFEILDNNDLAIRSKLASLNFRNSVNSLKYSQLSKLKIGHFPQGKFQNSDSCSVPRLWHRTAKLRLKTALSLIAQKAQFSTEKSFSKDLEVKI